MTGKDKCAPPILDLKSGNSYFKNGVPVARLKDRFPDAYLEAEDAVVLNRGGLSWPKEKTFFITALTVSG